MKFWRLAFGSAFRSTTLHLLAVSAGNRLRLANAEILYVSLNVAKGSCWRVHVDGALGGGSASCWRRCHVGQTFHFILVYSFPFVNLCSGLGY
ncbi:hypothetical protein HDK64DRAFT_274264 [Phyllosticta capitalensis]